MSVIPNKSFKLKFSGDDHADLAMEDGHIQVIEGKDQWIQANKVGLIGQEGDWRFDPSEGLPWVDNGKLIQGREAIMTGQVSRELVEIYIYQQLAREPRNDVIENVSVEWDDKGTRSIVAEASVRSIDGELIEVEV